MTEGGRGEADARFTVNIEGGGNRGRGIHGGGMRGTMGRGGVVWEAQPVVCDVLFVSG